MNDIYNSLKTGRTPEELVAEFTKDLNEAEAKIRAEEEIELTNSTRRDEFIELLKNAADFCRSYYPSLLEDEEVTDDESWGVIADFVLSLLDLEVAKSAKSKITTLKRELPVKVTMKTPQNVFDEFFKSMGF
jgi:hypothetical protein